VWLPEQGWVEVECDQKLIGRFNTQSMTFFIPMSSIPSGSLVFTAQVWTRV
jgi:hypothetical protein